jgi:hypothetical protein
MNDLGKQFLNFWKEISFLSWEFWLFPVLTIFFIWLCSTIGLKIFSSKSNKTRRVFAIHLAWIISSLVSAMIIIGLICLFWCIDFFQSHPWRLSLLFCLFIAMLITLITFIRLRSFYSLESFREITPYPQTFMQLESYSTKARKAYSRHKLWYFLPIAGFLFLLFIFIKSVNLISIVIDNSESTNGLNLSTGMEVLSSSLENVGNNSYIYLSCFEDKSSFKQTFDEITKIKNPASLSGITVAFEKTQDAVDYLKQISVTNSGSPLCEAIWKNYITIKQSIGSDQYKNKLLLIITDGEELVRTDRLPTFKPNAFFCSIPDFDTFFPSSNIHIIDVVGDVENGKINRFMEEANKCGYEIRDGSNPDTYSLALYDALKSFERNPVLIYWVIIVYVIMALIGFFIPPKRLII